MGPAFYVLAIMGCGDGAMACEQVARADAVFRSEEACLAETEQALIGASDQPYPTLIAECQNVSAQMASYWGGEEG